MLSVSSAPLAATPSGRLSYARIAEVRDGISVDKFEVPNLIELQLESFQWFIEKGLRDLFDEISPIKDFTGKVMELQFLDYEFGTPKYSEEECRTKDLTFSRPLYVNVELLIKETGEIQRQRVYMGDYPWMTDMGTFVINGAERVVVSQLVRSPGVYYSELEDPGSGRMLFSAKVIPNRGAWLEFETNNKDQLWVKVDRKRKIAATTLLRAVGYETNDEIAGLFGAVDIDPEHPFIANTLDKDLTKTPERGADRGLQEAAPGRSAHRGQRPPARREPVLQLPPVRPRPGRAVQVQQEAGRRRRAHGHRARRASSARSPARTSRRSSAT